MRARLARGAAVATLALALTACDLVGSDEAAPSGTPAGTSSAAPDLTIDSEFTSSGTFQSHSSVRGARGIDLVLTLYPTKATPRTNEWYPEGSKFFTFTFQGYDLSQPLRASFDSKRLMYLDTIEVTSATVTADGGATERPYSLDAEAAEVTFDPEPARSRYGMLITSPKGALELRNQEIGSMSSDTRGVELTFRAVVHIETRAGSGKYLERTVEQVVPIAIFASEDPTVATEIPENAS
ncbi:hypothetical protein FE634_11510 [Nocardioides dongxiaopingii]|uniref:hypothetical protein n=1 Tax=Nocardioides TaxID=1839 RepID=UPI0010C768F5|nr:MULTISPECIES: hypothetical protein [Nocardioides]QCW50875.1 hypothetical protein FE634_11510 [Nocardioides sp. S-1144]